MTLTPLLTYIENSKGNTVPKRLIQKKNRTYLYGALSLIVGNAIKPFSPLLGSSIVIGGIARTTYLYLKRTNNIQQYPEIYNKHMYQFIEMIEFADKHIENIEILTEPLEQLVQEEKHPLLLATIFGADLHTTTIHTSETLHKEFHKTFPEYNPFQELATLRNCAIIRNGEVQIEYQK